MKSKKVAYALWFLGCFGILGFHRFYLGKAGTGLLWYCTLGFFLIGALTDLFSLSHEVDKYNAVYKSAN